MVDLSRGTGMMEQGPRGWCILGHQNLQNIFGLHSSPVSFEPAGFFLREACAPKIGSFRARIQSYL